jgi:basic amino acid/polyamine antiporter, APA family
VERAFGPFAGFIAGALMWICNWASSAGVAAGLANHIATAFPALAAPTARAAFLIAVYALLATLNGLGVRTGTRAIVVLATLKLTPLFLLVAVGLFFVDWNNLHFAVFPGVAALGTSMVAVMFAYSGVETALIPSGEVRDPSRDVPRAAIAALVLVVLLYLGVQIVAQGMLGDSLKSSHTPIADTAGALSSWGFKVLLATASVSMLGFLQGNVLATSRLIYALGRDRYLPSVLGNITVTHRVPLAAIVTHATLACTLAIAGNFNWLILVSGGANCLVYVAVAIAAWQLQRKQVVEHGAPFVLPGGALIPLISCLALGLILYTMKAPEWQAIAGAMAVIVAIYGVLRLLRQT